MPSLFDTQQHLVEAKGCSDLMAQMDAAAARIKQMATDLNTIRSTWVAAEAAGTLAQADVDALDALKTDVLPLYNAASTYITARQS